jgi:hypothetical protein
MIAHSAIVAFVFAALDTAIADETQNPADDCDDPGDPGSTGLTPVSTPMIPRMSAAIPGPSAGLLGDWRRLVRGRGGW